MKLKTRLIIAFLTVILIPILLTAMLACLFGRFQMSAIEKTYEITGMTTENLSNTVAVMSRLTEMACNELNQTVSENLEKMEDVTFLEEFNQKLRKKKAYLLVRKENIVIYVGTEMAEAEPILSRLPRYGDADREPENGLYLGGEAQALVKQVDFLYPDKDEGSAFVVVDMHGVIPEVERLYTDMIVGIIVVLILTAAVLILWIYRGVMGPLGKMQAAACKIREGNLDFVLEADTDDELGRLCQSLEDMRRRLQNNAEEKLRFDKESKELLSNISHDLKTPVTTIKGYAEGIMDGVADTPEKMERYIRTIYNKASEMDMLINELTLYTKIDTNRIPYNFNTLSVDGYFDDCAEDLSVELESRGVEFGYFNYVEADVKVIADAEQIKRVVHNIVNNSLKYMDKSKGKINLRVKDVGDFVQVELEDNGRGIAAKDLANIFDRFYRTDVSRNSSKGGSGIGLSIVKKIIEEHGGKIWATSREETGTTMYFVLRKYQEVPIYE